jgi:hypothetical protein
MKITSFGNRNRGKCPPLNTLVITLLLGFGVCQTVVAGPGDWWNVVPEPETPSPYYDSILYSEIAPKLREIEVNSNRVNVNVIGQSAGGRNLFLATVGSGNLGGYQAIKKLMLSDPENALKTLGNLSNVKVPVVLLAGINGDEYPSVDAAIQLIEALAYQNDQDTQTILDNILLLAVVVGNPDGRVNGTTDNGNSTDLSTDFTEQSAPETKTVVSLITEWNPLMFLDLRGFHDPMLIEPSTPWHNPNYEYDLYLKWGFFAAESMENELFSRYSYVATIPYRDSPGGWDDWDPVRPATYAMYHGAYAHTLETPYEDARGVDALYAAIWGALKYVTANNMAMLADQIEVFRRGALDLPQQLIPEYILQKTPYDQYNSLTVIDFPAAYVIPAQAPLQQDPVAAANLVNFMLFNGVEVEKSTQPFSVGNNSYPKGTYLVWMDQSRRGLANSILWTKGSIPSDYPPPGEDLSWWPYVDDVTASVMETKQNVNSVAVSKAD